jgi:hypothetical protein
MRHSIPFQARGPVGEASADETSPPISFQTNYHNVNIYPLFHSEHRKAEKKFRKLMRRLKMQKSAEQLKNNAEIGQSSVSYVNVQRHLAVWECDL